MALPMTQSLFNEPGTKPAYVIFEFERRAYPLDSTSFTIGRGISCDIIIREPAVSRVHAELNQTPSGCTIKSVGVLVTKLNGIPLSAESLLRHGDQIEIGTAKLTFAESTLPVGVSIVDKSSRKPDGHDAANRRDTITNPILAGHTSPDEDARKSYFRPALLMLLLSLVAAYYFGLNMP